MTPRQRALEELEDRIRGALPLRTPQEIRRIAARMLDDTQSSQSTPKATTRSRGQRSIAGAPIVRMEAGAPQSRETVEQRELRRFLRTVRDALTIIVERQQRKKSVTPLSDKVRRGDRVNRWVRVLIKLYGLSATLAIVKSTLADAKRRGRVVLNWPEGDPDA
jgi:hypothetical protein